MGNCIVKCNQSENESSLIAETAEEIEFPYYSSLSDKKNTSATKKEPVPSAPRVQTTEESEEIYAEMKIGKVAQMVMRPILESGRLPDSEVLQLQNKAYCNEILSLNFPLLVKAYAEYDKARYYKEPIHVNGADYVMCSQWVERPDNNDRPFLMKWIREHQ